MPLVMHVSQRDLFDVLGYRHDDGIPAKSNCSGTRVINYFHHTTSPNTLTACLLARANYMTPPPDTRGARTTIPTDLPALGAEVSENIHKRPGLRPREPLVTGQRSALRDLQYFQESRGPPTRD